MLGTFGKTAFDDFPIQNLPQCVQIVPAPILIIEIVGMFPNIESQQRQKVFGKRIAGVWLFFTICKSLLSLQTKKHPARTE